MNTFKCLYHSIDVARALNTAVNSTICHLSEHLKHHQSCMLWSLIIKHNEPLYSSCEETHLLNWLAVIFRVHKFRAAKFSSWIWTTYKTLETTQNKELNSWVAKSGVFTFFKSAGVQVNTNDPRCTCNPCTFCSLNRTKCEGQIEASQVQIRIAISEQSREELGHLQQGQQLLAQISPLSNPLVVLQH